MKRIVSKPVIGKYLADIPRAPTTRQTPPLVPPSPQGQRGIGTGARQTHVNITPRRRS